MIHWYTRLENSDTHARNETKIICIVADFTSSPNHQIKLLKQKIENFPLKKKHIKMMIVSIFRVQLVKNQSDL